MKKSTKKILATVGVVGAAGVISYYLMGNIFYFATLTKKGIQSPYVAKKASGSKENSEEKIRLNKLMEIGKEWFNNIDKEQLVIKSTQYNKNLHADYIFADKETNICAIVIHGYSSNPCSMGVYAQKYHELGYTVLMPSLNGHADSESGKITMGWEDRHDIIDWINYLVETNPDMKIILHGVSMGAATTMMTTGESLPNNVKVAVADCGYTSVWDIFSNKLQNNFHLHTFPALYSMNAANKLHSGFDFKEASCVEQLKKSKIPTIFIHGDKDTFVPYEMLDKVYEACASDKEKVTIPNSPHARNACSNPELYWNSVCNFINNYI